MRLDLASVKRQAQIEATQHLVLRKPTNTPLLGRCSVVFPRLTPGLATFTRFRCNAHAFLKAHMQVTRYKHRLSWRRFSELLCLYISNLCAESNRVTEVAGLLDIYESEKSTKAAQKNTRCSVQALTVSFQSGQLLPRPLGISSLRKSG